MKHEQHPLDQFMKDKLSERSFAWQDADWDAASALLDAQRRRRRLILFWLFAGIGLLGAGGAILGWSMLSPAQPQNPVALWHASQFPSEWEFPDSCRMASGESLGSPSESSLPSHSAIAAPSGTVAGANAHSISRQDPQTTTISSQNLYNQSRQPVAERHADTEAAIALEAMKARRYSLISRLFGEPSPVSTDEWKQARHVIGLTAGLQLAPAWKGDQVAAAPSASPVLGVYYRYALAPRVRLQAGLLYQQRSRLYRDTTFTSVEFGFGRNETATTLSGRSLHFASLPVSVDVAVGKRQHLSLGVEPSWLAGVRTRVQESTTEDGVVTAGQAESTWGYPQGYQRWDVALQAGYHYYLGQGLRIGTVASYGLRDLTDNSYFTRGLNDRQLNWRIWLEYDLRTFGNR